MTSFLSSRNSSVTDEKFMKSELLFSGFICDHDLPLATADHAGNLFKAMLLYLKIANKYFCSRTKGTHILYRAKESISDIKFATNGLATTSLI